jgi:membrane-anchored protein YejM (alkaline phosphatase superfamily)
MDRTLVVITGDHGEMLGDEGGQLGHGWSAEPVLCNVPLIILDPRRPGYRLNLTPGSHVDLLPTVLDALAIDLPRGELYQGVSLFDDKAARARRIYLGSYGEKAVINGDEFARYDPDSSRTVAQVYEISHEGPRSEFQPIGTTTRGVADLQRFERLQRSLIRHYDDYRSSVAVLRAKQAVQPP